MFILASCLTPAGPSQSSPSLTAPPQPVPSPTVPSPTTPQPVSCNPVSTAIDITVTGTMPDLTVTANTSVAAASNAVGSTTAVSNATDRVPAWHAGFLKLLPAIERHARIAFRKLKREAREEAVAEVVANTMTAYVRLVELGKEDVAYATPLAAYAVAQFWDGRKVAASQNIKDVMSVYCQRKKGVFVERLDRWDAEEGCWQEILVEDKTCTPAELAASRIDFAAWLASLSGRDRKIAKLLASGCGTSEVAEKVGLSWARISQLRRELKASWEAFHEPKEDEPAEGVIAEAA